jgi:hypothetical protein
VQDRPTYAELLAAVRHFIETDVVSRLDGPKKYHARVAANVVAIVERELANEDAQLQAEAERLMALLGTSEPIPRDCLGRRGVIRRLTTELCRRIRQGDADQGEWCVRVFDHTRTTIREKLAVANPQYLEADDRLRAQHTDDPASK